MQIALVFCALFALATALPREPIDDVAAAAAKPFASVPLRDLDDPDSEIDTDPEGEMPEGDGNAIFAGSFHTKVDHTRPRDARMATFIYHANVQHQQPDGAFYVYIKDAGETNSKRIERGLMVDIAAITGASLFTFDQRYFGENQVTNDTSFDNLEFLTVEQIIGDIATFVDAIREAHNGQRSRVILWGSGVGATLAAYARKRYPHHVDAVWSSSGTFNIEQFTFSQYDFLATVLHAAGSEQCQQEVEQAFEVVAELVRTGEGAFIQETLNLCAPVNTTNPSDVGALLEWHVGAILSYINHRHAAGVQAFCEDMERVPGDALNSFARWKSFVFGHDLECFDPRYETLVRDARVEAFDTDEVRSGRRQWYWLQCTQLGLFSVTDNDTWLPNGLEPEYHLQKCADIFGPRYEAIVLNPAVRQLQLQFGSLEQRISNILYTNGAIDPWLHNGILATHPEDRAQALLTPNVAKSADLHSIADTDSVDLREVKQSIQAQIVVWSQPRAD